MDNGHLDVAGSSLTLNRSAAVAHRLLTLARKHDPELVAEVVFEVNQPRVWIDLLRSCVLFSIRFCCFVFFLFRVFVAVSIDMKRRCLGGASFCLKL